MSAVAGLAGASVVDSFINTLARVGSSIIRRLYSLLTKPSVIYALLSILPGIIKSVALFSESIAIDISGMAQSILQFANYLYQTVYNYVRSNLPTLSGAFSWVNTIMDALSAVVAGLLSLPFYVAGYVMEYIVSPIIQFFVQVELIVLNGLYQFLCQYIVPLLGFYLGIYLAYKGIEYFGPRTSVRGKLLGGVLGFVSGFIGNYELQALLNASGLGCQSVLPTLPSITITIPKLPSALVQLSYKVGTTYSYQFTTGGLIKETYTDSEKYSLWYGCLNCIKLHYTDSENYALSTKLPKGWYWYYTNNTQYSITQKYAYSISMSQQNAIITAVDFNLSVTAVFACKSLTTPVDFYVVCIEQSTGTDYGLLATPPSSGCSTQTIGDTLYISCTEVATTSDTGSA